MKLKLDTHTTIIADKDLFGRWSNIAVEIRTENGTQLVDFMQILAAIDHRHWRITGEKDNSLLDNASEKVAVACDEQVSADERARELAVVMLKKQLPFFDNEYARTELKNHINGARS